MKSCMVLRRGLVASLMFLLLSGIQSVSAQGKLHLLKFDDVTQLRDFFKYAGNGSIIVSGHRGGYEEGYAENCIEGLENVLKQMPAFFEIDPRLTKDSVIVLMHDATLDRTTTGTGTIINLDKKDVPMAMIAALIKKHKAERHVMLTVHTGAQARYYYDRFPTIMMSAFARNMKEFEDLSISGVPWENMIAYVGHSITPENKKIVEMLHARGVRCMISVAPTHDRLPSKEERALKYKEEIDKKPDIIESDIPTEVWTVLQSR